MIWTTHETRVVELINGRDLAWTEFGAPSGVPVFAFHGSLGQGWDFLNQHEVAYARGVRLIAVDRPGYGHSTFDPTRSFESWANDVRQLADHLRMDRFGVVGVSSGGSCVAAVAHFIGERLTGAAIMSGPAPPEARVSIQGMQQTNKAAQHLLRFVPWLLIPVMSFGMRRAQRAPEQMIEWMTRSMPSADVNVISRPEVRGLMIRNFQRRVAPTAIRAARQDFAMEAKPWGFRLRDIDTHVHVWHGGADRNVPSANGEYLSEAIPNATMHLLAEEGHTLFHNHFDEILALITLG